LLRSQRQFRGNFRYMFSAQLLLFQNHIISTGAFYEPTALAIITKKSHTSHHRGCHYQK
jgi:hypothetical protein